MEGSFEDRERQFEAKFAHDEEIRFKVRIHRNKLFAAWVVGEMGAKAPPGYAEQLVEFAFDKQAQDVIAKAVGDLGARGVATTDTKVRRAYETYCDQAREEVMRDAG